jgi:hypothetical protein
LEKRILDALPEWWKEIDPDKHYLVMTNDLDSLLSCWFLQRLHFGLEIGGFVDFKRGLYVNANIAEGREPIYIDCSMVSGKCFDNHRSILVDENPEMINPNKTRAELGYTYKNKYNGSTLAFLIALYGQDMSEYDEEKLTILLCIDSWYKGVYNSGGYFSNVNYNWFERLGMSDYLRPITDKLTMEDFETLIDEEVLHRKFEMSRDGYVVVSYSNGDRTDLPDCKMELVTPLRQGRTEPRFSEEKLRQLIEDKNVVSLAQTFGDQYQYSYIPDNDW